MEVFLRKLSLALIALNFSLAHAQIQSNELIKKNTKDAHVKTIEKSDFKVILKKKPKKKSKKKNPVIQQSATPMDNQVQKIKAKTKN